jgi:hypothetical protein
MGKILIKNFLDHDGVISSLVTSSVDPKRQNWNHRVVLNGHLSDYLGFQMAVSAFNPRIVTPSICLRGGYLIQG